MKDSPETNHRLCVTIERLSWFHLLLSMLSQVDHNTSFPAYTIVLGFWGIYISNNRSGWSVFTYISFLILSILLDVVFCIQNGSKGGALFFFSLSMMIICLLSKLPSLWYSSILFTLTGGLEAMRENHPLSDIRSAS